MNPNCFKATYQGDEVWFVLDESYIDSIPITPSATLITYTLAEAKILANRSEWTRKIVHEAKKAGGQLSLPIQPGQPKRRPPG